MGRARAPSTPSRGSIWVADLRTRQQYWAWPNDTIYLYKEPQTFLAFGASGLQGQFPFSAGPASSAWRMTFAEGVAAGRAARLGGRPRLGIPLLARATRARRAAWGRLFENGRADLPIVYSVNFSDPAGYFLATRVQMRDKDVIFAADAQAVEITKFAAFANTVISVPANGIELASAIQTNRLLFHTPNPTSSTTIVGTPATP